VSVVTPPARESIAWQRIGSLSVAFAVVVVALSGGYGYHRDELYFIAIGGHPAFGYVDQPPLIPLLAHAVDAASGHSLVWLRVPSALAGALVVLVTGLIAREFGGGAGEQLLASASMAAAGLVLGASHNMSTTTYDLLAWTVLLWLVVRAVRDDGPTWLLAGLVAGVSLEIKTLPIFLMFSLVVGVLAAGPRTIFASRWLWLGAAIALALWAPNLIWQATHDWPQLDLATSVASGNSGSSEPRSLFIPFQFLLMGPPLVPIWLAGLWRLWRDPGLALWRFLPIAYVTLIVIFLATGGKPYYLAGMYPVLFARAGPTLRWVAAGGRARRSTLVTVVAVSAAVSAVVALPIVPASVLHDTPIVAMNYDAGEQVGWPAFARTMAAAYDSLPAFTRRQAVVLTANYGEAGAVLRYAPGTPTDSGHNSLWNLGPPPDTTTTVIAIGYDESDLRTWFSAVHRVATIDNGEQLDNDEQGQPVWLCTEPTRSWDALWPDMRNLG
jgi:4-amino-4-deoxy-L-arabinose transferase-like glycosyltransferase